MDASERRFDRFVVEPGRRRLLVDGEPAKIGSRAFDLLLALIERCDRVVSKNELLSLVWPDATVEEGNLQVHIFALRKLLGADSIATIPGRGYRFTTPIEGQEPVRHSLTRDSRGRPEIAAQPGNLPLHLPRLHGREADASALKASIARHRLVSVVGPAGIGKTRLAQAVAHELRGAQRDGAWLVELAPIEKPELAIPTVARVLGRTLGPKDSPLDSLVEAMRNDELLLVLDNCEHLVDAVAELAQAILTNATGVRLLVTSQAPLRLADEQVHRLGSLAVPAYADATTALDHGAVALFVARAQAAATRFELDAGNVGAIVEICRRLDGVPLGIELAAARVPLLGVHGLAQRLDERLRLLAGGPREALPRHRALSAALEWSYSLLSEDEQHVLDRLGIFVGGFSLKTAQALVVDERIDEWAALEHLSTLIERSLVIIDPGEPPRYRLLETTRDFALQRLAARGALEATRRRHALALISTLKSETLVPSQLARAAIFAPDIDNLRAAMAWAIGPAGDRELAIELGAEADLIWYELGYNDEGATLFRMLEPWVDASTPPALAARFWLSRSKLYSAATRTSAEDAMKAAAIFRSLGDRRALFDALTNAAHQFNFAGQPEAAKPVLSEAKGLIEPDWPLWTRIAFEYAASSVKYWAGEMDAARSNLVRALELSRNEGGDALHAEQIEMLIVGCDVSLRHGHEALRAADELLERRNPPIRGSIRAVTESFRCIALARTGELAAAHSSFRAALPRIRRALGTVRTTLCHVAYIRAQQGRCDDAARLLGAVDALRAPGVTILAPPNSASYNDAKAVAAQKLGAGEFERLYTEGRALSEDEAVALGFSGREDGSTAGG